MKNGNVVLLSSVLIVLSACFRMLDTPTEQQQRYTYLDRIKEGHALDQHYDVTLNRTVGLFTTDDCADVYVGANRFWVDSKADGVVGGGIGAVTYDGRCVITALHVLNEASKACVVGRGDNIGYRTVGRVVWQSDADDLALLRLDDAASSSFGWAHSIGQEEVVWTIGIVSPVGGRVEQVFGFEEQPAKTVQSSLRLTYGDSGSPLVNAAGQIVGVNTKALANVESLDVNATLSSRPNGELRNSLFSELCDISR